MMDKPMRSFAQRRLAFLAGSLVLAAGLVTIAWMSLPFSRVRSSNVEGEFEAKVSTLVGKPTKGEPLPQREARFRLALSKGDYGEAKQIAAAVLGADYQASWQADPVADFMDGIMDLNDSSVLRNLDAWVAQSTDNQLPLLIRAQYEYKIGWDIRGHRFYPNTSPSDLSVFDLYMKKSIADTKKYLASTKMVPAYAYYLQFRTLQSEGGSRDRATVFKEAIQNYPDYYPIYALALSDLQPKWGGSVEQMYNFVQAFANDDKHPQLRLLYVDLYADLLNFAYISCDTPEAKDDAKSACMSSMMNRLGSGDLEDSLRKAFSLYSHSDRFQFGLAIRRPLQEIMSTPHAGVYALGVMQMAAAAMNSDVQLVEDHPGHNNYIIDGLIASSWYTAGNYANALRKATEALDDLPNTVFPSDEAKAAARADIYSEISQAKGRLHDYADQAAYEQASYVLGGRNGYEHAICFAFSKIGTLDETLSACDKALAENKDDLETNYWRAQTYVDHKLEGRALPDLERVARSHSYLRASAAIDISSILFNRNDNSAALDTLNKYSYLYDSTATSRNDTAAAYNNRCYAYMLLGNLRLALKDCNDSLKFGSLPDAYKKKVELERRLAGSPI